MQFSSSLPSLFVLSSIVYEMYEYAYTIRIHREALRLIQVTDSEMKIFSVIFDIKNYTVEHGNVSE